MTELEAIFAPGAVEALDRRIDERAEAILKRERDSRPAWGTLKETAERYRTTPDALRKRAERGQLPGAVKDGSRWLVDWNELDASLKGATVGASDEMGGHRANGPAPT